MTTRPAKVWNGSEWENVIGIQPDLSIINPLVSGAAAPGTSGIAAREDHIHPWYGAEQARLDAAANQSISPTTWTTLNGPSEVVDTANSMSSGIYTAGVAGIYIFSAYCMYSTGDGAVALSQIVKNEATAPVSLTIAPLLNVTVWQGAITGAAYLNVGETLSSQTFHTHSSALEVNLWRFTIAKA